VKSEENLSTFVQTDDFTFLRQVIDEAVNATFGKVITAQLARVLVSVRRIFEFRAAVEVLKDDWVGLATHDASQPANVSPFAQSRASKRLTLPRLADLNLVGGGELSHNADR
jgi:hypothetical protein